jgi:hypothetical protein
MYVCMNVCMDRCIYVWLYLQYSVYMYVCMSDGMCCMYVCMNI